MPKATQLAVPLTNKPGALAKLCSVLGNANVNITGIFAPDTKGRSKVRVMVDELDKARAALKQAKIRFSEEEVLIIELDNRPGAFGKLAAKLAQSKIDIKYSYVMTSPYAYARVVAAVPDVTKALSALGA